MDLKSFIKNSSAVLISSVLSGFFSFIFHPLVARLLSLKDFADLETLLSLLMIITVPASAIALVITRYISKFNARKNFSQIKYLKTYFIKNMSYLGFIIFIIFIFISPLLTQYLKIDSIYSVIATGIIMFFMIAGVAFGSIIQGMQKFTSFALLGIFCNFLRLLLGILFAFIFASIYGVLAGLFLSLIIALLITLFVVEKYLKDFKVDKACEDFSLADYSYYIHTFFIVLFLTTFFNIDIILVKNIFIVDDAAMYVSASILAKTIIFISGAMESVMFPALVGKYEKNDQFFQFFIKSGIVLLIGLIFSIFIFYIFGEYFMLLMGKQYLSGGEYLWKIAIFVSLFTLVNYFGKFFLAIKKTFITYILAVGCVLQIILGYIFSESLHKFISGMSYAMLGTLFLLICYLLINKNMLIIKKI